MVTTRLGWFVMGSASQMTLSAQLSVGTGRTTSSNWAGRGEVGERPRLAKRSYFGYPAGWRRADERL